LNDGGGRFRQIVPISAASTDFPFISISGDMDGDRDDDVALGAWFGCRDCGTNDLRMAVGVFFNQLHPAPSRDGNHDLVPDECGETPFRRGDPNADGLIDASDAIFILSYVAAGGDRPACLQAADLDENGSLELNDAVHLLTYLFLDGPPPDDPFLACGLDPLPDGPTCASYPPCE
jgi:hypothetical protein